MKQMIKTIPTSESSSVKHIITIDDGNIYYDLPPSHIRSSWEAKKRLQKLLNKETFKDVFRIIGDSEA